MLLPAGYVFWQAIFFLYTLDKRVIYDKMVLAGSHESDKQKNADKRGLFSV